MASVRKVICYDNFSGGDWGRRQAWNAKANQFNATNMMVYRTGELGVRPGIRNVTPAAATETDAIRFLSQYPQDPTRVVYGRGTGGSAQIHYFTPTVTNTRSTYTGAFGGIGNVGWFYSGQRLYLASSSGIYSLDTSAITALNTSFSARYIAAYNDRLAVASNAGTLRYNGLTAGVSDFTNWPAANIIPVGDNVDPITAIWSQRSHLTIPKRSQGIYVLTGQLGVNETLRQASSNNGPNAFLTDGFDSCSTKNDMVWWLDMRRQSPTFFDGARAHTPDTVLLSGNPTISLYYMADFRTLDDDGLIVCPSTTEPTWVYYRGTWTKHSFGRIVGPHVVSVQGFAPLTASETSDLVSVDTAVFCTLSGTVAPVFSSLVFGLDRPGVEFSAALNATNSEHAGDFSTAQVSGSVEFPEYRADDGTEFLVKAVQVDFRSWNTNGSLTNHFDVTVDALRTFNSNAPSSSVTQSWDEPGAVSSSSGTIKRWVFNVGDQGYGDGCQVRLTNIRGIAIQRMNVIIESRPLRAI